MKGNQGKESFGKYQGKVNNWFSHMLEEEEEKMGFIVINLITYHQDLSFHNHADSNDRAHNSFV